MVPPHAVTLNPAVAIMIAIINLIKFSCSILGGTYPWTDIHDQPSFQETSKLRHGLTSRFVVLYQLFDDGFDAFGLINQAHRVTRAPHLFPAR